MREVVENIQRVVMFASLAALAVMFIGAVLYKAIPFVTDGVKRCFGSMDMFGRVLCSFCVIGLVLYGGSKSKSVFTFDSGLANNGSYTTNDTVHIGWTYSGIPSTSTVNINFRLHDTTNEWEFIAAETASTLQWDGLMLNATNYDFYVYSVYVPPAPVHTNGVWVGNAYPAHTRSGFVVVNSQIKDGGKVIATPKQKEQNNDE